MSSLFEKYRPKTWAEVVGQERAINKLLALVKRGAGGRAYWISGQSGQGKTTIARILASEIADPEFVVELDASELTPARIKDLEAESHICGWGKGGRVYIVNEAHGLRRDAIRQFLVTLERVSEHVAWIFTTTKEGESDLFEDCPDGHPLLSRCVIVSLTPRGLCEPFAQRAIEIADREGLNGRNGDSMAFAVRLMKEKRNNMRAVLQAIESGEMLA